MANPKIKWHYSPVMLQVTDEAGQPYTFSPDSDVLSRANHTGTQDVSTITGLGSAATKDVGVVDGVAPLDATGKLPTAHLPALSITDVNVVASEAEQLALTAQEGDVAVRADISTSYIHNGGTAGTMADWTELQTPPDAVLSVFGRTGAVTAQSGDYTAAQISVADSGGNFTATDVEGALAEIPGMIDAAKTDYFTESRHTTAPNDTVPVHSWEVSGTETDIDVALAPRGAGAVTAQVPDGTAAGGAKRGVGSTDLQRSRDDASEVASGENSFIGGGHGNLVAGKNSWCPGGARATDDGVNGKGVYSNGGYGQTGLHSLSGWTTNAEPTTTLTVGGGVLSATNFSTLSNNTSYAVTAIVCARDAVYGASAFWKIETLISKQSTIALPVIVGTPLITTISTALGDASCDISVVSSPASGMIITVNQGTFAAQYGVDWSCDIHTVEAGYFGI